MILFTCPLKSMSISIHVYMMDKCHKMHHNRSQNVYIPQKNPGGACPQTPNSALRAHAHCAHACFACSGPGALAAFTLSPNDQRLGTSLTLWLAIYRVHECTHTHSVLRYWLTASSRTAQRSVFRTPPRVVLLHSVPRVTHGRI